MSFPFRTFDTRRLINELLLMISDTGYCILQPNTITSSECRVSDGKNEYPKIFYICEKCLMPLKNISLVCHSNVFGFHELPLIKLLVLWDVYVLVEILVTPLQGYWSAYGSAETLSTIFTLHINPWMIIFRVISCLFPSPVMCGFIPITLI